MAYSMATPPAASSPTAAALADAFPELAAALLAVPFPPVGKSLKYGTAGFRERAELLDSTFLRLGMLAAVRSR